MMKEFNYPFTVDRNYLNNRADQIDSVIIGSPAFKPLLQLFQFFEYNAIINPETTIEREFFERKVIPDFVIFPEFFNQLGIHCG